jgi:DeoR/GlpR family transcriptional regulator of sugar metabolism
MSKTLIPAQRRAWIQEYLAIHKIVRSIELLESEGIVERTHGGAIYSQRMRLETQYFHRAQVHAEEKRKIGLAAASLVKDGDIIFVNSGTTTTQFIRHLPRNAHITLITNNLSACLEIGESGFEILVPGGEFQPRSNSVAGRFAIENLNQVYASKAFIGVDGLTLAQGCTVPSNAEAEIDRLMIERTRGPIIILSDHSKWGVVSNFEIAKVNQINKLVTNEEFDPLACAELAELNIEIVLASTIAPM